MAKPFEHEHIQLAESEETDPQFRAIGNLSACVYKFNCYVSCTAFLIGPDIVAVAAHCITRGSGARHELKDVRFHSFGHAVVRVVEYVHVGDFTSGGEGRSFSLEWAASTGQDIAILRIEHPVGDITGWLPKGEVDWDEMAGGGEYEVVGIVLGPQYGSLPLHAMRRETFHLRSCRLHPETARIWKEKNINMHKVFEAGVFFHTCGTRGGFSGGPVLRRENGKLTWIGVTSAVIAEEAGITGYYPIAGVGLAAILQPGGNLTPRQ